MAYLRAQFNELRYAGRVVMFLILWSDLPRMGLITSDVVRSMSVTQSVRGWAQLSMPYPGEKKPHQSFMCQWETVVLNLLQARDF